MLKYADVQLMEQLAGNFARPVANVTGFTLDPGGEAVDQLCLTLLNAIGLVQAGKVRALAVTGTVRSSIIPDVPTMVEAGLQGYEVAQRYGIIASAHTPAPIVEELNAALRQALASQAVEAQITRDGLTLSAGSPDDYAAVIDREVSKWSTIVRRTQAKAN